MGSYLVVFGVAAIAAGLVTPISIAAGRRLGVVDDTKGLSIPRVGGWSMAFGAVLALVLVGVVFTPAGLTLLGARASIGPVLLGTVAIFLLGVWDDFHPLSAVIKLLIQVGVAGGIVALGVRIEILTFPLTDLTLGPWFGSVVTVVWFVGISNAFNLLDGADGIAAGSAFFASAAIFLMSVTLGHPAIGLVTAALAGGLLGFLPYNFPPAKAYLGDAGALLAGFLLAGLAVEGSTKGPTLVTIAVPIVAFGVPVFDTTITLIRRLVRGRPIFERDQEHVHHHLVRAGLTPKQVAGVIYATSAAFALAAMLFLNTGVRSYAVALVVIGAGVWMVARFLRLHELNELARVAKRGAMKGRSIAANVEVRRATDRLAKAENVLELMDGLAVLLSGSEFDDVQFQVAPAVDRRGKTKAWLLSSGKFAEGARRKSSDEWEVTCPFEGVGWVGELALRRRLGRKTLMVDINLIVEMVQPALAEAAGRIPAQVALST